MSETLIQRDIRIAIGGRSDCRLFRNNVAQGVVGNVRWIKTRETVDLFPGDAVVRRGRILHAGLCEGSSDLVGVRRVLITPDMVGRTVGLFVGLEVKDEGGTTEPAQERFLKMLLEFGAFGGIVRSVREAEGGVSVWNPQTPLNVGQFAADMF